MASAPFFLLETEMMNLFAKMPAVKKADNFSIIRLAAAITVVYGHSFPLTGTPDLAFLGNAIYSMAVKVFFVISGYLITESWLFDPCIVRYFIKRALRIFPALIVVICLSAIILGPLVTSLPVGTYFENPNFLNYFKNIYLYPIYNLPGVFTKNIYPIAVNGSLWSLPVEFLMYIFVPIILLHKTAARFRVFTVTILLATASLYFLHGAGIHYNTNLGFFVFSLRSALDVAPYFFIGSSLRLLAPRLRPDIQVAVLISGIALLIPTRSFYPELALYLVLPYTIIAFAQAKPAQFAFIDRIGDLSYGVYLFGFPFQQLVVQVFGTAHHPLMTCALALPPTLVCAYLSWHLVERRCIALKPKRKTLTLKTREVH